MALVYLHKVMLLTLFQNLTFFCVWFDYRFYFLSFCCVFLSNSSIHHFIPLWRTKSKDASVSTQCEQHLD